LGKNSQSSIQAQEIKGNHFPRGGPTSNARLREKGRGYRPRSAGWSCWEKNWKEGNFPKGTDWELGGAFDEKPYNAEEMGREKGLRKKSLRSPGGGVRFTKGGEVKTGVFFNQIVWAGDWAVGGKKKKGSFSKKTRQVGGVNSCP